MQLLRQLSEAFWGQEDFGWEDASYPEEFDEPEQDLPPVAAPDNVVALPRATSPPQECLVLYPTTFEEIPEAVNALLEQKVIILNCSKMRSSEDAQRSVDFLAGAIYAIGGQQSRIWKDIFLFVPPFVQVSQWQSVVPVPPFVPD
ncbi:cell division protein SepF [Phormidesmis sp. 146-35]